MKHKKIFTFLILLLFILLALVGNKLKFDKHLSGTYELNTQVPGNDSTFKLNFNQDQVIAKDQNANITLTGSYVLKNNEVVIHFPSTQMKLLVQDNRFLLVNSDNKDVQYKLENAFN